MTCCFSAVKIVAFTLTFLILLCSLAAFLYGAFMAINTVAAYQTIAFILRDPITFAEIIAGADENKILAWILISVGLVIFISSCLGCWSLIAENLCLLMFYIVFLCILFITLTGSSITIFAFPNSWIPSINSFGANKFNTSYNGAIGARQVSDYESVSLGFDVFMIKFKCCGLEGSADFEKISAPAKWYADGRTYITEGRTYTDDEVKVPVACCKMENLKWFKNQVYSQYEKNMISSLCPTNGEEVNDAGCLSVIPKKFDEYLVEMIIAAITVLGTLAVLLICDIVIHKKITDFRGEFYY